MLLSDDDFSFYEIVFNDGNRLVILRYAMICGPLYAHIGYMIHRNSEAAASMCCHFPTVLEYSSEINV